MYVNSHEQGKKMTAVSANRQPVLQCRHLPKNFSDIAARFILSHIFISSQSTCRI
jgi:hypothetical protein